MSPAPRTTSRRTELWAADGEHLLVPPHEVRQAAAGMKMSAEFDVRGHRELENHVTDAHERFIAPGEYGFRRRDDAERLRDVVKFRWEMVSTADTSVGRIRSDYQLIER